MAVLVGAGVSSAVLNAEQTTKIFPMLLWVVFLLSSATSATRFNEQELEGRGFEGLLLAGVTGSQMYLSKCIVLAVFLLTSFIVLVGVLSIALDQDVYPVFGSMIGVGVATSSALSALLVLLAAIASTSKLKGVLLPVISLPLLFPVFLCGLEMTTQLVVNGVMDDGAPWPYLLLCANALYLVAGINLFDPAIRE
jgi:ABC-type transport system involved in cytochrome c biogenesis permease component